jgi:acyl transferase domain-containing protein/NAD(P)-dependent dehydrogenase (short-subunit alcohol dehydrogenase family)/acyl carrier protein
MSGNPRISSAQLALAVKKLRADRESLALLASDPIAIIGMACRFPGGGDTPEAYWTALQQGRNCVSAVSESRWHDAARLEPRLRWGGYLDEIDGFDAAYFGITPREAREMDPQQRLLLEIVWEALWDAGIAPESLAGSDTGVFAAIYNHDFARLRFSDAANLPAHGGVGAAHSVAAGRISFLLDLRGPSLALDTACSSSLVAAHLACQSLRAGECSQAIVASSSLKLLSDEVVVFSKWGMLASNGKCKTFDAGADGFVPGEGSGVVVLKRLADALRDGDRVHAVIRGSAMNHDGRTTVLTAPNGLAQEAVLRAALENARLAPDEVSYVETHGTGTSLGDPIEVEALGNVYGRAVSGLPCVLGAVKTNLGHLEASAGMAGLIKAVMCLRHQEIPRNLHFERLNSEISLEGTRLVLAAENRPWPRGETPRVAGISSFGLGGTNAHLIVEEAPLVPDFAAGTRAIPLPARKWQRQKFPIPETCAAESAVFPATANGKPLLIPVDSAFVQGNVFAADLSAPGSNASAYSIAWRAANLEATPAVDCAGERWLLAESSSGSCAVLAERLQRQGAICEIRALNDFHLDPKSLPDVVVLDARGLHAPPLDTSWTNPEQPAIEAVLQFVKAIAASTGKSPKLRIVTASAVAVLPLEDVAPEQAPLWGLVRTLALEYPETEPLLMDAGSSTPAVSDRQAATEAMLCDEILSSQSTAHKSDSLIAFRQGQRYVARLVPTEIASGPAPRKLRFNPSGRLEEIEIVSAARIAPGPREVEIQVHAAGLNFRDVLTAMGALSPRVAADGAEYTPGAECAGIIVRVGDEVRGLHAGDAVLAFAPGALQSFVTVPAEFVVAKPAGMTFAEAAGIPVAFLTAYYSLETLAKLRAGQTVLIHAAAGGLGLAAVQLALRLGARVFATAGSEEKRAWLRQLGVEHVFDSRSLEFSGGVLAATGGAGVDVVLNSLAEEFLPATFATVARGGCLLEVGKRGIWTKEQVAALDREIRYYPFDLGEVALANPAAVGEMLRILIARFSAGELRPLPASLYSFTQATSAFCDMAQARHIGKLVFAMEVSAEKNSLQDCISGGTVLVTGGSGALGIETARWLAANGATRIVLASRNSETEPAIAAELRAQGIAVAVERADVADAEVLGALLARVRSSGAPLRAVFHTAGVAQDAVLAEETGSHYREATAAKIQGAWNLHWLTCNDPVRLMVFYSSAAAILGSPGQGSYAAGNAFLDALAHHRASRGLRTLSVDWGAWAGAGMASRLTPEQAARWTRQGATPMAPAEALDVLTDAIESGQTQAAILRMDWSRFLDASQRTDAAFFRELATNVQQPSSAPSQTAATHPTNFLEQLRTTKMPGRRHMLAVHIQDCARKTMGLDDTSVIDNDLPLQEMGLDSLMALEMRNDLAQSLEIPLPAGLLFDIPAVNALADHLLDLLFATPATDLAALSEEEAERLLIEELDRAEREKAHA